VNKGNNRR